MTSKVPVLCYHSVGIRNYDWNANFLTCNYKIFENQLKWIKNKGFKTITLKELYDYMNKGYQIPKKSLVLTFDDGFLDNWVFAYPLLKKYGLKGSIYVSPEFTAEKNLVRPNLIHYWEGERNFDELETLGFLSWKELKIMQESGLVDIQSHTMSHTWYPQSNEIIDFRYPNDPYIWMTWNENKNQKPFLQIDNYELVKYGQPVYKHERSIGVKRYFPDDDLNNYLIDYVGNMDHNDFSSTERRKILFKITRNYLIENKDNGFYETDQEYEERMHYEIYNSRKMIEKKLKKDVKFICWPGGVVTERSFKLALSSGYLSSTRGKYKNNANKKFVNTYGEKPNKINRIFPISYWDGRIIKNSKIKYDSGFNLILRLNAYTSGFILSKAYLGTLIATQMINKLM